MLSLEDVSHVYANGTRALDLVTLSIPRGMYGLLSANGAGKSTLMRAIATLQTPTSGRSASRAQRAPASTSSPRRSGCGERKKYHADARGGETETTLAEGIEVGLFTP